MIADPHAGQPVARSGVPVEDARAAAVLLHGRGGMAAGMLPLARELGHRADLDGFAHLAPQAADFAWYPEPFMAPIEENEPGLSSALGVVGGLLDELVEAGVPAARIALLGFSQGACLALEYAARHPRRYGAVVGFSGGLVGPPGTSWNGDGKLEGTPVFIGCGAVDPHIPISRVDESAAAMEALGGSVTRRIYPELGHTVNDDELDTVASWLAELAVME